MPYPMPKFHVLTRSHEGTFAYANATGDVREAHRVNGFTAHVIPSRNDSNF